MDDLIDMRGLAELGVDISNPDTPDLAKEDDDLKKESCEILRGLAEIGIEFQQPAMVDGLGLIDMRFLAELGVDISNPDPPDLAKEYEIMFQQPAKLDGLGLVDGAHSHSTVKSAEFSKTLQPLAVSTGPVIKLLPGILDGDEDKPDFGKTMAYPPNRRWLQSRMKSMSDKLSPLFLAERYAAAFRTGDKPEHDNVKYPIRGRVSMMTHPNFVEREMRKVHAFLRDPRFIKPYRTADDPWPPMPTRQKRPPMQ